MTQLEHQVDVVLVLEESVQLEDGGVFELVVDLDFMLDTLGHAGRLHYLLVNLETKRG